MRRLSLSMSLMIAVLAPSVASADVAPDPDPWMACEGRAINDSCFADNMGDLYDGYCAEQPCPDDMNKKCLYCTKGEPPAATSTGGTTGASSTGAVTTGGGSSGSSGGSSGSSSGGAPPPDDSKGGCGCSSAGSPGAALGLLALLGLARRRRGMS